MPGLVLNSLYNNTYVKLAIGYEASPGASTSDTDAHEPSPFGSWGAEALTAALVESNDGSMNLPALFCMKAYGILVVNAYAFIQNKAGKFIEPSLDSTKAAV